jgi:translation initiation factor IF-2
VVDDEKEAREISARRRQAQREREMRRIGAVSLDHLYEQIKAGAVQTLNMVIKGDVDGSVEALAESLEKLSTKEIRVNVIHKSVGAIKETDIMLAAASNALIIGFHLSPNTKIREMAKKEGVDIRIYRIIYQAVEEMQKAMEGMLAPEIRENILGVVEVKQVFKISKLGLIAGCEVQTGTIRKGNKARIIRADVEVADTEILTLRRHQDEAREVLSGQECGISFKQFSGFEAGDRIEVYEEIEVARKLSST